MNIEEIGMAVGTAAVELAVLEAVEQVVLDTAGACFQLAEQMGHSKDPLAKLGPREPMQQMEPMVPVNVVNELETVVEVGSEVLEVEAEHSEQEGKELPAVGKGAGLAFVTAQLLAGSQWLLLLRARL